MKMSLQTLMPFIIKVIRFYLPRTLFYVALIVAIIAVVKVFGLLNPGNLPKYRPGKGPGTNALKGKRIIFLGSSVTRGMAAYGRSFVDMLAAQSGAVVTKEAVSGTTLVEEGSRSYIARLNALDKNIPCDVFVCQLSTNDAARRKPLGVVSAGTDLSAFDTGTICGAIEYIIAYAKQTWNCPVVFYTSPQYASPAYMAMTEALRDIAEKWDISIIDLWCDAALNERRAKGRSWMNDRIHPTQKAYQAWTPIFEAALSGILSGEGLPARPMVSPRPTLDVIRRQKRQKSVVSALRGLLACVLMILLAGGITLYQFMADSSYNSDGNGSQYLPENQQLLSSSPLRGKTILSIGSSVSVGTTGNSFEDYLEVLDGAAVIPLSEGATTIAIREGMDSSYTERFDRAVRSDWAVDAVIIQVSTNDASAGNGIGAADASLDPASFDRTTSLGGLEYLIASCHDRWNCPIFIYSCVRFGSNALYDGNAYGRLVESVQTVVNKWNASGARVIFIDQWNDEEMNAISHDQLVHYMCDPVHPSMAGYLEWWMPNFQKAIYPWFE